ncbi:MAG: hypothetical protein ACOYK8_09855 [Alphaproteobacteria bacterium]
MLRNIFSHAKQHIIYQLMNAEIKNYPFEHLSVDSIFPPEFYDDLQFFLPKNENLIPLNKTGRVGEQYSSQRLVLFPNSPELNSLEEEQKLFWQNLFSIFADGQIDKIFMKKFARTIGKRYEKAGKLVDAVERNNHYFLMRDLDHYALGPHTDSLKKLVSVLFYLPKNNANGNIGTSFYWPKDSSFRCAGGPHHRFEDYELIYTFPFKPNSLLAFAKSDYSFHGVEPLENPDIQRDILLFDIEVPSLLPV